MAHTVYIRGIPGNTQVTEVRVHTTPGLNTEVPFKVAIGGTATCTAVQVDPANDSFQGQTYKWFDLTFPDGRTGWVRDDLLDLEGDCSAFGYGNYATRTFAFSALVANAAPAAEAQPAATAPSATQTAPAVTVTVTVTTPTTPTAPANCVATVRSDSRAKVRALPSVNANVLGGMDPGQQTPVQNVVPGQDGQNFRWIQTTFNGSTGYIREDLLTYSADCVAFGVGTTQPAGGIPDAAKAAAAIDPGQKALFASPLRLPYQIFQEFGDTRYGSAHKGADLTTRPQGPSVNGAPLFSGGNGFVHYTIHCTRCSDDKPNFQSQGIQFWDSSAVRDPAWGYGFGNHVVLRYAWAELPSALRQEMTNRNLAGGYAYVYYAHLQRIDVLDGAAVTPDTQIGLLGNTGNSNGHHIHIELHISMYDNEHDVFNRLNLNPRLMYSL
jgi:murein DD-endopeptidase MepM/ murein hydrolase activator NlpD